jgi:hypothetical protein
MTNLSDSERANALSKGADIFNKQPTGDPFFVWESRRGWKVVAATGHHQGGRNDHYIVLCDGLCWSDAVALANTFRQAVKKAPGHFRPRIGRWERFKSWLRKEKADWIASQQLSDEMENQRIRNGMTW